MIQVGGAEGEDARGAEKEHPAAGASGEMEEEEEGSKRGEEEVQHRASCEETRDYWFVIVVVKLN